MKCKTGGFTLIEVMISLAITASLLVTVLYTLNYYLSVVNRHEVLTTGTLLARMKLYEMEKNPLTAKGYFDKPYSGYYYETAFKNSFYPSMMEVYVVVKSGRNTIRMSEVILGRIDQ